ncbi:MAG: chorismate mutase [Candidatus Margulisbacteria bacterium]|nr:chorismate mutase [Candidatus Margulisiibacteriota bacterium]
MPIRGIRGATTVEKNAKAEILAATKELLTEIQRVNELQIEDIASIVFTVTQDLDAEFPAAAAREMGWQITPLLCNLEINVPGSLPKCIRVLLHVNSQKPQVEIKHSYLRAAVGLRR